MWRSTRKKAHFPLQPYPGLPEAQTVVSVSAPPPPYPSGPANLEFPNAAHFFPEIERELLVAIPLGDVVVNSSFANRITSLRNAPALHSTQNQVSFSLSLSDRFFAFSSLLLVLVLYSHR